MLAFIAAAAIVVVTFALAALVLFANAMSDAPSQSHPGQALWVLAVGLGIAALVLWSHWWTIGG